VGIEPCSGWNFPPEQIHFLPFSLDLFIDQDFYL